MPKRLFFGIFLLAVMAASPPSRPQNSNTETRSAGQKKKIERVFVEIKGDQKLVRRLWTFLDFQFEDAGIGHANTPDQADLIISGDVHVEAVQSALGVGVAEAYATSGSKTETFVSCGSTSTDTQGDLFDRIGENIQADLRKRFPDAKTLAIASGSDVKESTKFEADFLAALPEYKFSVAAEKNADIALRIRLVKLRVTLDETVVKYEIGIYGPDGKYSGSMNGNQVNAAKLHDPAPRNCANSLNDLDWMISNDPLYTLSRDLMKNIRQRNTAIATEGSAKTPT